MSTTPEDEMYFHRYSGGGLDMFEFEGDPYAAIGDTFKVTAVVELAKVVVDETKDGQRHILGSCREMLKRAAHRADREGRRHHELRQHHTAELVGEGNRQLDHLADPYLIDLFE